jgi:hypothetical protein
LIQPHLNFICSKRIWISIGPLFNGYPCLYFSTQMHIHDRLLLGFGLTTVLLWVAVIVCSVLQFEPGINLTESVVVVSTAHCKVQCRGVPMCQLRGSLLVELPNQTNTTYQVPSCCMYLNCCQNMTLWLANDSILSCTESYRAQRESVEYAIFGLVFAAGITCVAYTLTCLAAVNGIEKRRVVVNARPQV